MLLSPGLFRFLEAHFLAFHRGKTLIQVQQRQPTSCLGEIKNPIAKGLFYVQTAWIE